MKRRRIAAVTLLILALSAAGASAAGSRPVTGTWSGKAAGSADNVRFKLTKTKKGYRAKTTRILVVAGCTPDNANAAPSVREIPVDSISVKLRKRGKQLTGLGKVSELDRGGQFDAGVRLTFTSARRAKVVLSVSQSDSQVDENGNILTCTGRTELTAKTG